MLPLFLLLGARGGGTLAQHTNSRLSEMQHRSFVTSLVVGYVVLQFNPLESRGNYSATSNDIKLMGGLLHLVQRGGDWADP